MRRQGRGERGARGRGTAIGAGVMRGAKTGATMGAVKSEAMRGSGKRGRRRRSEEEGRADEGAGAAQGNGDEEGGDGGGARVARVAPPIVAVSKRLLRYRAHAPGRSCVGGGSTRKSRSSKQFLRFAYHAKASAPVFACSLLEAFKVVLHIPRSQGFCCNDPPRRFAHSMLLGAQNEKSAYFERILLLKRRGAHRRPCAKGGMRAHARRVLLARGPAARERARALVVYWYTR